MAADMATDGFNQPATQFIMAFFRNGINVPVRFSFLLLNRFCSQFFFCQPFKDWINLTVAFTPEAGNALFVKFFNIVARHRTKAQNAQYGVFALVFFHSYFYPLYICVIYSKKIF